MNNLNRAILKLLSMVGMIITSLEITILTVLQITDHIIITGGEWAFMVLFSAMFWIMFIKLDNSNNND